MHSCEHDENITQQQTSSISRPGRTSLEFGHVGLIDAQLAEDAHDVLVDGAGRHSVHVL
jgi:hypothetical protein